MWYMSFERNADKVVEFQRRNLFWAQGLIYLAHVIWQRQRKSGFLDFQPEFFLDAWPPLPTSKWHPTWGWTYPTHTTNICELNRTSEGNLQGTGFLGYFRRTLLLLRKCSSTINGWGSGYSEVRLCSTVSGWDNGYPEVRLWSQADLSLTLASITHDNMTSEYLWASVFSTIKCSY